MIKVNEYFEGNVKSLGFENAAGRATVGVMAPGAYTFNTGAAEEMTLITGAMSVKLPGDSAFRVIAPGESYHVPANSAFDLQIGDNAAYLCRFLA